MKVSKVELLERAQQLLEASITLIEAATKGDANTKAYLVDQLKTFVKEDHGYLCSNLNLDKVMRKYQGEDEDAEYDWEIEDIMEGNF